MEKREREREREKVTSFWKNWDMIGLVLFLSSRKKDLKISSLGRKRERERGNCQLWKDRKNIEPCVVFSSRKDLKIFKQEKDREKKRERDVGF